jgi:hypothetical protein
MLAARLTIVSILMLVILAAYSPSVSEELGQAWKDVRPAILGVMDSVYATIRNFVAGSDADDGMDDNPPGVDFDMIVTMDRENFL